MASQVSITCKQSRHHNGLSRMVRDAKEPPASPNHEGVQSLFAARDKFRARIDSLLCAEEGIGWHRTTNMMKQGLHLTFIGHGMISSFVGAVILSRCIFWQRLAFHERDSRWSDKPASRSSLAELSTP
ncbi:hypothetical protein DOTSEDRAFT_20359 [Dothistroma septosporum NZE10]|uniref:Uncharacterized protein n=1 Tax=Dothistroma septosporum (strain NZE10 / CBS 128990) TaxID=675120 RepID=N1Q2P1_DOTSN|nr:hypothetical protein DOTSEDRAFT_20359 [Dothistroma septosporum NZE10]